MRRILVGWGEHTWVGFEPGPHLVFGINIFLFLKNIYQNESWVILFFTSHKGSRPIGLNQHGQTQLIVAYCINYIKVKQHNKFFLSFNNMNYSLNCEEGSRRRNRMLLPKQKKKKVMFHPLASLAPGP